jgi:hypothetical protein
LRPGTRAAERNGLIGQHEKDALGSRNGVESQRAAGRNLGQPPGIEVGPLVKVFDGRNRAVITEFNAYDARWRNGVWVSTADVVRNGRAEILTGADSGGGPHVRVFDGLRGRPLGELYPFPLQFNGGVRVAAHDVNNDGVLDFICAPGPSESLRSPPVRIFDGRTKRMISEFIPFEGSFRGGAFVGAK